MPVAIDEAFYLPHPPPLLLSIRRREGVIVATATCLAPHQRQYCRGCRYREGCRRHRTTGCRYLPSLFDRGGHDLTAGGSSRCSAKSSLARDVEDECPVPEWAGGRVSLSGTDEFMKQPPLGWSRDPVHLSSRRKRTPSYVISIVFAASLVLSAFAAAPAQAQDFFLNSEATVPPFSLPPGANLNVGTNGQTGTLTINTNGSLMLNDLSIGGFGGFFDPGGGTGTVNVTGPSASLVTTGSTIVGASAAVGADVPNIGALNITGGGQATVDTLVISSASGGAFPGINVGTVLVSGPGSTLTTIIPTLQSLLAKQARER